jgi:Tol biopolymer transport system component
MRWGVVVAVFLTLLVGGNAGAQEELFVYQAYGLRPGDIWTMNADGTGRTNLTNSKQDELSPAWSPDRSRIAFVRWHGQNPNEVEIWVMNSDGSGQARLTSGSIDESPSWSPDGSRITFSRKHVYTSNPGDIFVMNADGSGETNLTNDPANQEHPDWSPDGSKIAYTGPPGPTAAGFTDIHVMNADGSGDVSLTDTYGTMENQPRWSPDGTKIAYTDAACCTDTGDIYMMNADGTGAWNVTHDLSEDSSPSWSADSSKIAFTRWNNDNYELFITIADASGRTNLTNDISVHESEPDWSRDGTRIVYVSGPPFLLLSREIFRMNADGSGQTDLTNNPWTDDVDPSWAPGGERIAFASRPKCCPWPNTRADYHFHIYVMNPDGSAQTRLTSGQVDDRNPDWSPDGRRIAFNRDGDVYVMNADGSGLMRLTSFGAGCSSCAPSWSPDGSRIAFGGVLVMNADGSGQTRLTYWGSDPTWSPDGSRIAFSRWYEFQGTKTWVMDADGGNETLLSDYGGAGLEWSPDGTRIAFGGNDVGVINADGSNPTNLSNYPFGGDASPAWSPDGGSIAFDTYRVPDGPQHPLPSSTPGLKRYARGFLAPACFVPRVIGLRLGPAQTRIRRSGCRVGRVRSVRSRRVGRVLTQKPRAGSKRALDARVTLVIGRQRRS